MKIASAHSYVLELVKGDVPISITPKTNKAEYAY